MLYSIKRLNLTNYYENLRMGAKMTRIRTLKNQ